jgi:tetratricopeptide (TPR) repeat protein
MYKNFLKVFLPIFLALFSVMQLRAQNEAITIISADNYYKNQDYVRALIGFERYLKEISEESEVFFKSGYASLMLGYFEKSAHYFKRSMQTDTTGDAEKFYWIAKASQQYYEFDTARKYYRKFLAGYSKEINLKRDARRNLRNMNGLQGKVMAARNQNSHIKIINLGEAVNSVYSEDNPICNEQGTMVLFSSKRQIYPDEVPSDDNEYPEKLFITTLQEDGSWSRAEHMFPSIDRTQQFLAIQFLDNDKKLLLMKNTPEGILLFLSEYSQDRWQSPYLLPLEINNAYLKGQFSFTKDMKVMYFTYPKRSIKYRANIFYTQLDPATGKWSRAKKLNKVVNSTADDFAPVLLNDETLYFSSNVDGGFGGFDVYRAKINSKDWMADESVNLGYPINQAGNEYFYVEPVKNRKIGFLSAVKGDTFGSSDIYMVVKEQPQSGSHTGAQ